MNAALRETLRQAIDQHARTRRQALIDAGEFDVCGGCGGELGSYSIGCKNCWDRKRRLARRADPANRILENERDRKRRQRDREKAREARETPATIDR